LGLSKLAVLAKNKWGAKTKKFNLWPIIRHNVQFSAIHKPMSLLAQHPIHSQMADNWQSHSFTSSKGKWPDVLA
jgi:hypothetical protein